ncbi:hypothetical protein KW834_13310 [Pseudomonas sp. PDM29]|uniref:hypothetical protein n=1 Tax=Pseudomonas sp. PDM29 TaxID=2854771 RepID=UPI001C46D441|nr:hypothetical protein [Pseudomonas sp. PDM29]MBV7525388.1 hypothetical protein [Pseudomonas sp. PDM29]
MARPVTADHILFDECINAFRESSQHIPCYESGPSRSYLLTDFNLPNLWEFPHCTVHPSTRALLAGANSAFISAVDNPSWGDRYNAHLYGIALSAVVTFATGRLCKSTRDSYLCVSEHPSENVISELSLLHPVLISGPGNTNSRLSEVALNKHRNETAALISKLYSVPHDKYIVLMQAIRLVHLSKINKRDDFGLAYLLVVSAIESIAQHAIPRKKVAIKHPNEESWSKLAPHDESFSELLKAYKEARGQNGYLKERYISFIKTFAPASIWEQIVPNPGQEMVDYLSETTNHTNLNQFTQRQWREKYPSDLNDSEITAMLSESYTHRSFFIHRGEQPPHQSPTSMNRFFQEEINFGAWPRTGRLLPNYELLIAIARHSILGWMESIKP